jgi:uncharacterized membrane protein YfcA
MRSAHKNKSIWIKLGLAGLAAGVINGLLSAGGGIVVVIAMSRLLGDTLENKNDIFANALCVMLPLSLFSCMIYALGGDLVTQGFGVFALPAIIGGAVGGALLGKLRAAFVKKLFAALVIISGMLLIVR